MKNTKKEKKKTPNGMTKNTKCMLSVPALSQLELAQRTHSLYKAFQRPSHHKGDPMALDQITNG